MNVSDIRRNGREWLLIRERQEALETEREDCAREIELRANKIAKAMVTQGHRLALITRSTERAHLTGVEGDTFSFEIIDGYDGTFGWTFTLTADQLADPEPEIARLNEENRRHEIARARENAEQAQRNLARLVG